MLKNIQIVLVETSHPGNIGAAARAMKNMGLDKLALVKPYRFPDERAIARAAGADDILEAARIYADLDAAVADSTLVIGASARLRTVEWPQLNPRECAAKVGVHIGGQVSLVFGRERSGLTNAELDRCSHLVHIPSNPEYSSLNLAMAVQVITYELAMLSVEPTDAKNEQSNIVSASEMQGLFEHLELALVEIGFADPRRSDKLLRRLKRLFYRATPDQDDINILRGILSAAQGRKSMHGKTR